MTLEIIRSDYTIYAFTLRKTKNPNESSRELLTKHLCGLAHGGVFATFNNVVFEETGGLHCHGIVTIPKFTNLARFRVRGFKMHLVEIYDLQQWYQYLNKDQNELLPDMCDDPPDDFVWPTKKLF